MGFIAIALILNSLPLLASEPSPHPSPSREPLKVQVQPLHADADLSEFKKDPEHYETHPAPRPKSPEAEELPSPEVRNRLLFQAGLEAQIKTWDDVDRDVFFMRARTLPFGKFRSHYPDFSSKRLHRFQELAKQLERKP